MLVPGPSRVAAFLQGGRPRGLRQLPFATSLGAGSSLGEHSCFVAVICCSEVAQDGMGGRSRTGSQQLGATPRSGREDRRGKFEVRSQTRAAVKERESEDRRGASEDIA